MELLPASDDEKWDLLSKRVIDLCDYYVVIVGGRYGSVDDVEQLSYTEMEFDYPVKSKKPVMGFLRGNPGKLIGEKIDLDKELREKLDSFRDKIEKKMVKTGMSRATCRDRSRSQSCRSASRTRPSDGSGRARP
jgi:hypothetical protein